MSTTKKTAAQLDREIDALLESFRRQAPYTAHVIPDNGYLIGLHGAGGYVSSFGSKADATRAARALASETRQTVDIVKVQNRGNDRFVVDEIEPGAKRR